MLNERGMKVSFTHIVAWAIAQATKDWPVMVRTFEERDGRPSPSGGPGAASGSRTIEPGRLPRSLMVPAMKGADRPPDFAAFHASTRN